MTVSSTQNCVYSICFQGIVEELSNPFKETATVNDSGNSTDLRFGKFRLDTKTWHLFGEDGQRISEIGVIPVKILKHIIESKPNLVRGTDEAIRDILAYYNNADRDQQLKAFMQYVSTLRRRMGADEFNALFPNTSRKHDVEMGVGGYTFIGEVIEPEAVSVNEGDGDQAPIPIATNTTTFRTINRDLRYPLSTTKRFKTLAPRFAAPILMSFICLFISGDRFQIPGASIRSKQAATPNSSTSSSMTTPRTKILVLEFDGPDPKKYQVGHIIATALEQAEITIGEDVDIEGSDQIITATGDGAEEEARRIGRTKNATAVIWGFVGATKEAPVYASFVPVGGEAALPMMFGGSAALMRIPIEGLEDVRSQYQLANKLGTLVRITVGLARMQRGDFDGLDQEMDQAVKSNPVNNEFVAQGYLLLYRAISRMFMYDIVGTLKDLVTASNERNDAKLRAVCLSLEADIYAERLDYIKFNSLCEQVHHIPGAPIEAVSLCGRLYWQIGDEKKSSLFLGNILTITHPTLDELPSRIRLHLAFCQLDEARDDLEYARRAGINDLGLSDVDLKQIASSPTSLSTQDISHGQYMSGFSLFLSASRYTEMREFGPALLAVNELLGRAPSVAAYASRAEIEALTGDPKHSIQDLDQAISKEPSSSYLHELRATEYDDDHRYNKELADLSIASKLDLLNAELQSSISNVLFDLGRKKEGYKHLRSALSLEPTYAGAYFQLGVQQLSDGAYSNAIQSFTTEINLIRGETPPFGYPLAHSTGSCLQNPDRTRQDYYVSALLLRANAGTRSEQFSLAEHDLQEALELDPSASNTHALISVLAEEENDFQRALVEIDKAIALDGRQKQYLSSRERILQEMKAGK